MSIEGVGDVEVEPGTRLDAVLRITRAPAAVWCGGARLDGDHRAGVPPLLDGALLRERPGPPTVPPRGPHLRVVAGPDAGGIIEVRAGEAAVGREGAHALADAGLSRRHLALDAAGRARDLGSRNGTMLVRGARTRRLGRARRRLRPGDLVLAGATVLRWIDPAAPDGTDTPRAGPGRARLAPLLAGLGGGAAGGLALGVATGRWELAAVAVAAPLALAAASVARGSGHGSAPPAPTGIELLATLPGPVAVRGECARARAAVRAVALARDAALPRPLEESWMRWLPGRLHDGEIALVGPDAPAPSEARTLIDLDRAEIAVDGRATPWRPCEVSAGTADPLARMRASTRTAGLPREVRWSELDRPDPAPGTLVATLGQGPDGPVRLDLDVDGPHVLVAGTTGSGKSALLETLVTGLAHDHPPRALGIALVDLKGGAGLGACASLPHARGLLTDLEPTAARRALLGLAHELRSRKALLADAGAPSWAAWAASRSARGDGGPPPRLLMVVDEFQELAALDPGFLPELARLAAQGRSLGVHLILATQRPAGVVTPEIRANVASVIALRTASEAESHDVLGDAAAAGLPASAPGRAVVVTPRARTTMQGALPLAERRPPARRRGEAVPHGVPLAAAAARRWDGSSPPDALWRPPLSAEDRVAPGTLGWLDLPESRDRAPLAWDPREGPLVIVGPRGSGRTAALDAVAAALPGCVRLPRDPREAARTLALARGSDVAALLVDDADRACAALDPLLRGAAEELEALSREVPLALAAGPAWGTRWAARAGLRVILAGLDRVEQALWGVPAPLLGLPPEPGRGVAVSARGAAECRLARVPPPTARVLVRPLVCPDGLAPHAVGVIGDEARPWTPAGPTHVTGRPGAERDAVAAALERAGVEVTVSTRADPAAAVEVVAAPTPALLRELGLAAAPGVADASPPGGRVVVRHAGGVEAAQLRGAPARSGVARCA
ncbi:FtsK/SpoIIIE domain-containing protein [Demequina iriomotensis]|uniref:FtsK/SpoIIIE domain-containing protein n=1 Tax=Demequina iriomotensis TaxID=1536641 RepID=UPI000783C774|nr:FtsK/SpoIIIE domain-containing protein [Demequina iriomotensis]